MKRWSFEQDAAGLSVIRHNALPRFCAYWTSGAAKIAVPLEVCWTDSGSGEDDCLHLYGMYWIDTQPDPRALECLMKETVKVIDTWIVSRM
jgi:hypothetical protein